MILFYQTAILNFMDSIKGSDKKIRFFFSYNIILNTVPEVCSSP